MYRFYFFENRRVDGRMKIFPLPGQTTYPNHGSTRAAEEPVSVDTEVQMNILDRALVCTYRSGHRFGVKMEGSSRRQIRLMAYSDRGRTYYKVSGLVPIITDENGDVITDPEFYNVNRNGDRVLPNEEMVREYRAYISRMNGRDETNDAELRNSLTEERTAAPVRTESFPVITVGRLEKVRCIGNNLADSGMNGDRLARAKYSISLLLDMLATGGARFVFRKQNGDERIAYGTLREDIINEIDSDAMNNLPSRGSTNNAEDGAHVNYFDLEKRDWRCFCTEDFISLEPTRLTKAECLAYGEES